METSLQLLIQKYQRLLERGKSSLILTDENDPESFPKCQPAINAIWKIIIKDLEELADKKVNDKSKYK